MIPILYASNETAFTSNGIGRLRDCISCTVTEQRNGKYECEFEYPITGKWYHSIQEGMYISCIHDDTKTRQPFIIYKRTVPVDGIVKFYCRHVSYLLNNIVVEPYTASDASSAISGIPIHSINTNPFTFWTDKTTSANFDLDQPVSARGVLGGVRGSVLDVYGGEYEFDHFTVKLYANRGVNAGATIRYGKNLADIEQDIDNGDTYDSIVPFWYQNGDLLMLDEKIIGSTQAKPVVLDMSGYFQDKPTQAQLRAKANSYLTSNRPWVPKDNIKVNFVQLWQTDNYKDFAALQRVNLCDRVNVYYTLLGITAESVKVIKTVYNVLLERYDEMELGEAKSSFGQTLMKQTQEQIDALRQSMITTSVMQAAIDHATQLITGGLGGHVVYTLNADGEPEEILIMDTANVSTAVNVIRMNKNGIGFSTHGYAGPYTTAWTIDGHFNADFITAGAINASLITTGTLNANVIRSGIIQDTTGNNYWNLTTGAMSFTGNFKLSQDYNSATYKALIDTVTFNRPGTSSPYTRLGLLLSAKYGNDTGELILSPGVTNRYNAHVITADRALNIQAIKHNNDSFLSRIMMNGGTLEISLEKKTSSGYVSYDGVRFNGSSSGVHMTVASNFNSLTIDCGNVDILRLPTTSDAANLNIKNGTLSISTSSSKRYKHDITTDIPEKMAPERLYNLPICVYKYNDDYLSKKDRKAGKPILGFIAEDVDKVYPDACQYDDSGKPEMWNSQVMIPAMMKLIQDQKKEIEELKMRVAALEKKE